MELVRGSLRNQANGTEIDSLLARYTTRLPRFRALFASCATAWGESLYDAGRLFRCLAAGSLVNVVVTELSIPCNYHQKPVEL
jgi:hypothetical protein